MILIGGRIVLDEFIAYYENYLQSVRIIKPFHIDRIYARDTLCILDRDGIKFNRENKIMNWFSENMRYVSIIAESKVNLLIVIKYDIPKYITLADYLEFIKQEIMALIYILSNREIYKTINVYLIIDDAALIEELLSIVNSTKYTEGKFTIGILNGWGKDQFTKMREIHSSKDCIPEVDFKFDDLVEKLAQELGDNKGYVINSILEHLKENKEEIESATLAKWIYIIKCFKEFENSYLEQYFGYDDLKVVNSIYNKDKSIYKLQIDSNNDNISQINSIWTKYFEMLRGGSPNA